MVGVDDLLKSVFLAILCASATSASPLPGSIKHATHHVHEVGKGTFGTGIDHPFAKRDSPDLEESAIAFIGSKLSVSKSAITFKWGFTGETARHAFVEQTSVSSSRPSIPIGNAIAKAEELTDGKYNDHPPSFEFLALPDSSAVLTHVIQIQNDKTGTWVEAFIDAHTGRLRSTTDFVNKFSYLLLPIASEVPTDGFQVLVNPQDTVASRLGWHGDGTTSATTTASDKGITLKGAPTPQSGPGEFIYPLDPTAPPTSPGNVNAAIVNAFYVVNTSAFNFQTNNLGNGGQANDRVAFLSRMQPGPITLTTLHHPMLLWTFTDPSRDGALENDILVHENTLGITNGMTDGGTGRWTEHTSADVLDYVMGQFVTNNTAGIRLCYIRIANSLRYSSIPTLGEVHDISEVWANMLHNVYAALVGSHSFSTAASTDPGGTKGNILCNPTLPAARDAWIQADVNKYGGANVCLLW
ncbi:hypothetical protein BDN71DRAFT_1483072 [Pleurotus eryngii]|uniref:Extracellular metalloproteinase n=1 Tax=Pleurotus eryngii TaxID=5323 RepID=A0A9P5ZUX0_PLEER|nr:hypothetical protein BDN71DRAFT_1483072 [Pleurotus eryngii]